MQLFGICVSGHCISLPAWNFRGIAKFTELEGCVLAVAQLISMALYQCKIYVRMESCSWYVLWAQTEEWEERNTYYWRAKYSVKMWSITVRSYRWLSSFWRDILTTLQNMSDCKKSSSQIVRHKEGVFGGWAFIVVLKMNDYG